MADPPRFNLLPLDWVGYRDNVRQARNPARHRLRHREHGHQATKHLRPTSHQASRIARSFTLSHVNYSAVGHLRTGSTRARNGTQSGRSIRVSPA
jgi:hypothetical protein